MERTYSQETEAPLSDGAYDMLVEGLGTNIRGGSIFPDPFNRTIKTEEATSHIPIQSTSMTTAVQSLMPFNVYNVLPPCAQGLQQALPPLTRAFSFERHNIVPANPSRVDYGGIHNFSLQFEETCPRNGPPYPKSIPWTYSESLKKLLCQVSIKVPIKFQTNNDVPQGAYVRAIVVAKSNDTDILTTCPRHTDELKKKGCQNVSHVLQCSSLNAAYGICPSTQRHSVRFPLMPCQVGVDYQCEVFSFQCYSSCFRKEVQTIFTLELNGEVLGRRTIGVRVCACPGRDRDSLERKDKNLKREERQRIAKRDFSSSDDDGKRHKKGKKKDNFVPDSETPYVVMLSKEKYQSLKGLIGEESPRHLCAGPAKPLERTPSGNVASWLLTNGTQLGEKEN